MAQIVIPTQEEYEELKQWFIDNEANLPETMQIDKCMYTSNLKATVTKLLSQVSATYQHPYLQGNFLLLKKIRKSIEEKGASDEKK